MSNAREEQRLVEIFRRAANAQPWLHPCETGFIAVAADRAPPGKIRHFPIDDLDTLTTFVLEYAR